MFFCVAFCMAISIHKSFRIGAIKTIPPSDVKLSFGKKKTSFKLQEYISICLTLESN